VPETTAKLGLKAMGRGALENNEGDELRIAYRPTDAESRGSCPTAANERLML